MLISDYCQVYLKRLFEITQTIDLRQIENFFSICENARNNNNKIFFAGNGGSSATASHFASDFLGANIKMKIKPPYQTISLTDNNSVITALGNDNGFENIFIEQLKVLFEEGDILIAISASGNSENLVNACKWVKGKKGISIGWLGFNGGKLNTICDNVILINTPIGEYAPVEDMHLIINHILVSWMHIKLS